MEKFLHKLAEIFTHEGGIVTWCVCTIGSLLDHQHYIYTRWESILLQNKGWVSRVANVVEI